MPQLPGSGERDIQVKLKRLNVVASGRFELQDPTVPLLVKASGTGGFPKLPLDGGQFNLYLKYMNTLGMADKITIVDGAPPDSKSVEVRCVDLPFVSLTLTSED